MNVIETGIARVERHRAIPIGAEGLHNQRRRKDGGDEKPANVPGLGTALVRLVHGRFLFAVEASHPAAAIRHSTKLDHAWIAHTLARSICRHPLRRSSGFGPAISALSLLHISEPTRLLSIS